MIIVHHFFELCSSSLSLEYEPVELFIINHLSHSQYYSSYPPLFLFLSFVFIQCTTPNSFLTLHYLDISTSSRRHSITLPTRDTFV